jgi:hypothetical protein
MGVEARVPVQWPSILWQESVGWQIARLCRFRSSRADHALRNAALLIDFPKDAFMTIATPYVSSMSLEMHHNECDAVPLIDVA